MGADHDQHRPFEDLAVRHVVGALDAAEASAFRSHLLDCGECRARVGELRSIDSALADVERTERRARAAKQVETKQKERERLDADEVDGTDQIPSGGQRAVMVAGLVLIIVLSVWNFVLRGQNEGMEAALSAEREAAAVVNFGVAWATASQAVGVEGVARMERGSLAVLVRGTEDTAPYRVQLHDARGALLHDVPATSQDAQVWYFLSQAPANVVRVDVTLDRGDGDTIVFRAEEPGG